MTLVKKTFEQLTTMDLYRIYQARVQVFVVEQNCAYQEVDAADLEAIHLWLEEDGEIQAYLRILPVTASREMVTFGRVLALKRGRGLASQLLEAAIKEAEEGLGTKAIRLEAQTYARSLYEKQGFKQTSEEFLEDGIPHIEMKRIVD